MKKVFSLLLCLLATQVLFTSCEKDDDNDPDSPYSKEWFGGKQFTGRASDDTDVDWWLLSMDAESGPGYDGHFKIVPYWGDPDGDHGVMKDHETYTGLYQIDYDEYRLYIAYDRYSANYVWTFYDDYEDEWPYWNPNRYIQVPSNATGEMAGTFFMPGNRF